MSDVNRNKLRALATGCRDEVIRSHGWEGTIEGAELIGRDRRLLMELSPAVVIQLLDDYDDLLAENATLRADRDAFGQNAMDLKARAERAEAERDQLRAELAAIRGQEPVAWASPDDVGGVRWSAGALQQLSDGSPLYALPPQQPDAVSVPREQTDIPLYAAINRACGELPDGWSIEVNAERDGAWVALLNAELEVVDFPTNNERLDYTVNDAVDFALLSTSQAEVN